MKLLNREPGKYLTDIYSDLEEKILLSELDNNKEIISKYIVSKY